MIFPKNQWVRFTIPKTFTDVDGIYEDVLFNGLVFFWEEDNGEASMRYQFEHEPDEFDNKERMEEARVIYDTLKKAYEWAKVREKSTKRLFATFKKKKIISTSTLYIFQISSNTASTCGPSK